MKISVTLPKQAYECIPSKCFPTLENPVTVTPSSVDGYFLWKASRSSLFTLPYFSLFPTFSVRTMSYLHHQRRINLKALWFKLNVVQGPVWFAVCVCLIADSCVSTRGSGRAGLSCGVWRLQACAEPRSPGDRVPVPCSLTVLSCTAVAAQPASATVAALSCSSFPWKSPTSVSLQLTKK